MDFLSSLLKPFSQATPATVATVATNSQNTIKNNKLGDAPSSATQCDSCDKEVNSGQNCSESRKSRTMSQTVKQPKTWDASLVKTGFVADVANVARGDCKNVSAWNWSDTEIAIFTKRTQLFQRRGMSVKDAEQVSERLLVRDRDRDDRRLCIECRHCNGKRCQMGSAMLNILQRCPRFTDAVRTE